MQREGIFREMKLRGHYEKPSEKKAREKAEAVRRARKLARKRAQREGLIPMKPKTVMGGPGGGRGAGAGHGGGHGGGGGFGGGGDLWFRRRWWSLIRLAAVKVLRGVFEAAPLMFLPSPSSQHRRIRAVNTRLVRGPGWPAMGLP